MTEEPRVVAGQQRLPIDEAVFARSLGIDPEQVMQGSIAIELRYRSAVVTWSGMLPVNAEQLHEALNAAEIER